MQLHCSSQPKRGFFLPSGHFSWLFLCSRRLTEGRRWWRTWSWLMLFGQKRGERNYGGTSWFLSSKWRLLKKKSGSVPKSHGVKKGGKVSTNVVLANKIKISVNLDVTPITISGFEMGFWFGLYLGNNLIGSWDVDGVGPLLQPREYTGEHCRSHIIWYLHLNVEVDSCIQYEFREICWIPKTSNCSP